MSILLAMQGAVAQGVLWSIMTLGVYLSFRVLDFADLTVDGSFATGGAVSAVLISSGMDPLLSPLIAFIIGCMTGVITALLHTKLKINGILASILTMIALYSINIRIMGKANIPLLGVDTLMTNMKALFGISKTVASLIVGIIFVVIIIFLLYWFFGTELGCAIRATGNNKKMVRAQGVHTDNMIIIGLAISNGLVALSGGLVAQSQGYADVMMGTGTIVIGLASVIIGEVLFRNLTSFFKVLIAVVLGSVIYRIIIAVVLQLGLKSTDLKLFTAIIVALALALPVLQDGKAQRKQKKARLKEIAEEEAEDALENTTVTGGSNADA
ncbi:MAG: ABC transporter permease [Treponema sp. CETP13]|nr:MAG: ABC transporter permease [Treponema sp. CETP13]